MNIPKHISKVAALILMSVGLPIVGSIEAGEASAIVNGVPASEPYEFFGSLQRLDSPRDDLHVCGVTLVGPKHGVTAGHCARNASLSGDDHTSSGKPRGWKVRFNSIHTDRGGELVNVVAFTTKNARESAEDIAVLKFDRELSLTPAQVATNRPKVGTPVTIMGFGLTDPDSDAPNPMSNRDLYPWDLQQAEATIRSSAACTLPVTSSVMCIGGPNGERSDNMDSGGPAVRRVPGGGWELVGHVVAGSQTADYSTSTFADTARHAKWITSLTSGRTAMPAATGNVPSSLNGTARVGDCSGVVVDVPDARPTDGALVLTNGHCASPRPEPGAATGSVIDKQTVMVLDRNGYTALRGATVERIYSTMTDTDLAVYRTDLTYAAIRRSGLDTYELADEQLQPGDRLTLVSSAWGAEMTCSVEAIVPTLQEGGYRQRGAIRYTQSADCGPGPGTSGAPLLNADGKIVGLHNTSVSTLLMLDENDEQIKAKPCDVNNPCEVAEDGTATLAGGDTAYGQHLYGLAHCLSIEGMNFQSPGCDLIAAPGAGTATASSSTWVDWVVPIGLVLLIFAGGVTRIILPRGRQDRVSPTDDDLTA